ncbi:MAG: L,D-transpeptidase family protein [Gemmatimonadetes bacterium]|nr:L,D-transpeptidase family protein [Gemmatimonadota bacterium]
MAPALRFESELHRFYGERGYAPVWLSPTNRAGRIDELLAAFRSADLDGLRSDEYGAADVAWMFTSPGPLSPTALAEVELYLSDAFLRLAHDLSRGRVDPLGLVGEWSGAREPFDAVAVLKRASLPSSASSALDALRPSHPQYGALRDALAFLRGGEDWVRVPSGETLKVGDVDGRVVSVRERLVQSGDLATRGAPSADLALFDPVLEDAVRAFQRRHGFDADGLVGPETLSALNVPASERALQVAANMERWRWLPNDLGDRRVVVNVPDFSVTLEEGPDAMPVRLRAIVGRTDRETPTFSSTIESFSLAPYWNVPENLARQDILPSIRADTMYLDRAGMTVIDLRSGELVDGRSLDWAEISDDEFLARYRLRQEPGPANSLGDLRIAFPNPYTVFLHDTPARSLFEGSSRAFSSGCIRVERSFELLDWLLAGDPEWTQERITEALEAGEERSSRIREPVPIHVLYLTALVEEDGRLGFRPDVYGLDAALERALMSAADSDSPIAQPMIEPCS